MKNPDDQIQYGVICESNPIPKVFSDSYESAVLWAKEDNPVYRPYYIVECVTTYEICGVVGRNGRGKRIEVEE